MSDRITIAVNKILNSSMCGVRHCDKSAQTQHPPGQLEFSKTHLGKRPSDVSSALRESFPIYPESGGAHHAQCGKEFGAIRQLSLQIPRMKDCLALSAGILPVVCPNYAAHLNGGGNIITYA